MNSNDENEQKSESIKEGGILKIANNILHLLDYSQQLEDEEILFSDEFYISILSNLLTEQNADLAPGETPEEKVKSLTKLIQILSEIIEIDLSQISAEGIIMKHDKESAKSFLELIEELIKTLINSNTNEEEVEGNSNRDIKNKKEENEFESVELVNEINNNSANIRKIRERMKLSDDIENEENENSSFKRKYAELKDGIDNLNDANVNFEEEEEVKSEEKENENNNLININYNLEDKNNESDSRVMNVSHISEMEKNKIQETSSSKKKSKKKREIIELDENNPSSKKSGTNNKGNKKKYEEIPNLLIDKIKKNESSESKEGEIGKENEEEDVKYNNYLESNSNEGGSNLYEEENYNVPQSVPRAYNKLRLSDDSKESENSNNHYIRSKKKLNKKNKENENQSSNNTNSNISLHSKKNNKEKNITDEYNGDMNISSANKKIEVSLTDKKNTDNNYLKESKSTNTKKITENNENNIPNINEEEDDISKSSEYSKNVQKSSKKSSASKKSKISQNKKISYENMNYIEIPMSNEEMKYLIKKELRKLYGEKASQYFKKEFLELISENLKAARKMIIKLETGQEADDFFSREFFQKYLKEMQKLIKNCVNELNKENLYKKNVIMNLGNNINMIKKLKDSENKEISNDIEYKKNEFDSRNDEKNMNNLNQILMYPSYCYELQKKIYLLQTQNQIELNYALEKERENKLEETKKNYEEQISALNKILKRRKKERLNKKKFGELLESSLKEMKKSKLRKQVEDMLDQIDEEDDKINVEDNNEQIEKIMKNIE